MVQKLIPVLLIAGLANLCWANTTETQNRWEQDCAKPGLDRSMEIFCRDVRALDESMRDEVGNYGAGMMETCRVDRCQDSSCASQADKNCAQMFGYGVNDSTIAGLKGNSKAKSGSNCAGDAECATMEVFFTNFGISRSASTAAILYGLGKIDKPEARAAQENFLNRNSAVKRQIDCAAEQAEFFEGQCARMVSVDDVQGEPYKGDATKFFSQEFFGLGEDGLNNIDLSQSILAAFNQCAGQGKSAAECRLEADMFTQKNLTDGDTLKDGVKGSIYVPSDSFLNAVGSISSKHNLDEESGRKSFVDKLNQNFAGDIIPRLIEETKLSTLHEQIKDDESRLKYCKEAGTLGVKPPSDSAECKDAYYAAYVAKNGTTTTDSELSGEGSNSLDRDKLFAVVGQGEGRKLTSGEDMGLAELAEAHGAFAAIRELSLIEARNNPDIFRQATLYAGGTPIKATNLAREAASTGTPNPKVQNYAQASSGDSGMSPMGGMGRMIDGDADADGDSGASGVEPRVSGAVLPPAQGSDVRPEGEGSMDAVARAKHMLEERPTGSFPPSNIHDYNEDYMECSTQCRNGMADGPGNFMDQLIVYRNSSGSITRDVFRISENPDR